MPNNTAEDKTTRKETEIFEIVSSKYFIRVKKKKIYI